MGQGSVEIPFYKQRREICNSCEHLKIFVGAKTCGKCGCSVWGKTLIPFAKCPIDKWGPKNG